MKHHNQDMSRGGVFLALFICVSALSAQVVKVSGDMQARLDETIVIAGVLEDRYALLEVDKNQSLFHIFHENLSHLRTVPIVTERTNYTTVFVTAREDVASVIYYYKDRGTVQLCLRQFDAHLQEVAHDTLMTIPNDGWSQSFLLYESQDQSKVAVTRIIKNQKIQVLTYDLSERQRLYDTQITSKSRINNALETTLVTNDGATVTILDRTRRGGKHHPVVFEVHQIDPTDTHPNTYTMELPSLRRGGTRYIYDDKHGFVNIYGHYADEGSMRMNGLYVLRYHRSEPEIRYFDRIRFDKGLEADILAEARDKQPGILDLQAQTAVLREDGGLIVLSEIVRIQQRVGGLSMVTPSIRSGQNWTDYYHEDLICMSIHPDLKAHWQVTMHKKQYSQDDQGIYSSFFTHINRGALHLFYNDEIANNSTVSKYVIQGDGHVSRSSVMSTDYTQLKLRFDQAYQLDGRSLLVPSRDNNTMNLVKISY